MCVYFCFLLIPGIFLLPVLCLLTSSSKRSHSAVRSMRANWRTFFMSAWERSWMRVTPRRHFGQITRWEVRVGKREEWGEGDWKGEVKEWDSKQGGEERRSKLCQTFTQDSLQCTTHQFIIPLINTWCIVENKMWQSLHAWLTFAVRLQTYSAWNRKINLLDSVTQQ